MRGRIGEWISRYWVVVAIAAFGVGVRLLFLASMIPTIGFEWLDPDGYLFRAYSLIDPAGQWRWTPEAVRYSGPYFKAPLYPVLLSLFEFSPRGYGLSAGVTHALLGGLAVVSLWSLVSDLHSRRAACVAALVYSLHFSYIVSVSVLMQERLYVPLLLAGFALLARSLEHPDRPRTLALAGAVLGLAALTRSMPVYFVLPAAWLIWKMSVREAAGPKRAAWFLAGFAAIVVPYTLFISAQVNRFVLIENIGAFGVARLDPEGQAYFPASAVEAPSTGQIAEFAARRFLSDPVGFVVDKIRAISGTLRPSGFRWLDSHASFPTAFSARLAKFAVHLAGDLPFVLLSFAAPFGYFAARNRSIAAVMAIWFCVHLGMTVFAGYAGQRFREPIDWVLFAFGACLLSRREGWVTRRTLLVATALVAAQIPGVVTSIAPALESRADYGIAPWDGSSGTRTTRAEAAAGFKTGVLEGRVSVFFKTEGEERVTVFFRVDGEAAGGAVIGPEGYRLEVPHAGVRAFVEVSRVSKAGGMGFVIQAPSIGPPSL